MKPLVPLGYAAFFLVVTCGWRGPDARLLGLSAGSDGFLMREGARYRGIGVNYFDAFSRTLVNPADTSYREGFADLARLKIPFARFMACGFWPKDWTLYLEDKEQHFRRLDGVVRAAEESRVGLIPSLF